jgi:hypothetical protein
MQQQTNAQAGKTLGIIGLVLGILALVFSFVPCLGMYAIFPAVLGLGAGIGGFLQANKVAAPKSMAIAAIVLSIAATGMAAYQYTLAQKAKKGFTKFTTETEKTLKELDSLNLKYDSSKIKTQMNK